MRDDQPPNRWVAQTQPYEAGDRSAAPVELFPASPRLRAGAHRAAPEGLRSWRRPVRRPEIALLAAAIVVLLVGAIGVARLLMATPASSPPTTPSDDAGPLSTSSEQAATTPPAVTPEPAATTIGAAPTTRPRPVIEKRIVTETKTIAFETRTVRDNSLAKGTRTVRTKGVPGVRTLTYEVTLTDGVQTAQKLVRSVVSKDPVTEVVAIGTKPRRGPPGT